MDPAIEASLSTALNALHAGDPEGALVALTPALARAHDAADLEAEMVVEGLRAPALQHAGRTEEALASARRARELATTHGDAGAVAYYGRLADALAAGPAAMDQLDRVLDGAWAAMESGDAPAAVAQLEPELGRARALGPGAEASISGLLAQALARSGRLADARPHARRALTIAEALGDPAAAEAFRELIELLGTPAAHVQAACEEAGRHLAAHRPDLALATLEPAAADAAAAGLPGPEASARGLLAQALLALGRRDEARTEAEAALAAARQTGERDAIESLSGLAEALRGFLAPAASDEAPGVTAVVPARSETN